MSKDFSKIKVGIDFDNTIICYDEVFNQVGVQKGLIPADLPMGKTSVRDYLRSKDQEDVWIWLQGYVYGTQLHLARTYDGFDLFLDLCRQSEIACFIISHKTRHPYSGEKYDLHQAASEWIAARDFGLGFFFETTKEKKIERIHALDCDYFIDDLPEFLSLEGFPDGIVKILFDPLSNKKPKSQNFEYMRSWQEIVSMFKMMIKDKKPAK